ncbi:MAG TPA: hypothetical protein VE153_30210 [Myxococcus sp.]|jgi:uncharacterized protein (DUF2267 family)|nr:hypothetical protein [Myxococcus sp.]
MSTPTKPQAAEIVDAPPELIAKAGSIIAELEREAKTATGTLQQVLRSMANLLTSTKNNNFDVQLYNDVKNVFQKYMKEMSAKPAPMPPVVMTSLEWLQTYIGSRGAPAPAAAAPAAAASAPAARPAAAGAGAKDGFEKSAKRAVSLSGEAPPPPAAGAPLNPKTEEQQLESFKAWMKNPALGKLKG